VPAKERIQKVLSAQGIGSRREVEAWIGAGRIAVNGVPAVAGQAIGPRDDVRLDGRRLRLRWDVELLPQALVYHRPAREGMRAAVEGSERSTFDRLPRPGSGRWVPVSPMGLGEGGLELFVNDGALAASLMSGAERLSSEFSVRVRGEFDESRIAEVIDAAVRDPESKGRIDELEFAGGDAANRWARVVTTGLRPRDLKRIFERCGIEANRILRTRFGPIGMERSLARGVSRKLTTGELAALADAAGVSLPRPTGPGKPRRPAAKRASRARRPTGSRKPAR
jgi:23S rRNA pseudouridine2605 synthase